MPNWNPLTNAVGGAGATLPQTYYNTQPTNLGEYQYIKLTEIVDNFMAAYTGQGKILQNVLRGDVNFHAHRALQELHYDTLKSCKSQEIEVCPSLKMPLPHDYVNYVKVTSVDSNGIEHVIYPTRHTSHPFAIQQDECAYEFNEDGTLKHQTSCDAGTEITCTPTELNLLVAWANSTFKTDNAPSFPIYPNISESSIFTGSYRFNTRQDIENVLAGLVDAHCECLSNNNEEGSPNCGTCLGDDKEPGGGFQYDDALEAAKTPMPNDAGSKGIFGLCWSNVDSTWLNNASFPTVTYTAGQQCTLTSNAFSSFSTSSVSTSGVNLSFTSNPTIDNDNFFQNKGQRYGIVPEHAQINGSFYIDCLRGNIHFGSNFSGKTVILHYISDGHGTPDEEIVHKFAEEAMYKWIAYGCAQARVDVDPNTIARLKRERFAETRKAKIRLSNLKIEEVAQVMRNKSKWIKH